MDAQACSTFESKSFHVQRPVWRTTLGKGGETHMTHINTYLTTLALRLRKEEGQTMAEYGVVLAVITVACVAIFGTLAGDIKGAIQAVIDILPGGSSTPTS
jgi:Flp pilus assembly pilin Flp